MLTILIGICAFGPMLAPHPIDAPIGTPGDGPSAAAPLGTDFLGRDVLSRVLNGGASLLLVAAAAVLLTYVLAITIGMLSGYSQSWLDSLLMRTVDLFLVFPPLLLLLVLVVGVGGGDAVLILGIVMVLFPGGARLVRTATLEVSQSSYVEAAIARGESTTAVLRREILPNITPALTADAGVRFLGAIFLVASLNFLGVGSQPPASNWALMIAENRVIISSNIWSVLAPAVLLAFVTVAVNLIGDAHSSKLEKS
ncbi:ABC transporter permease [Mycolicibacterium sp. P9-64]|uniref:ABC transporter permease n=1 Tax=Mycolicibacterium sp. P9-64 TaxID=2024612 RepID=UPI001567443A|nr:ABC transporter permease [Mycolicibacterium sp. P9-64]